MRVAIVSTGGPGRIPDSDREATRDLFPKCGFNTGNFAFWGGIARHIANEKSFVPWSFNPDQVRANYDALVFPAANQINSNNDLGYFADLFERTQLPCVVVGLGAQADKVGDKVTISAGTRRWLSVIAERSLTLGVRGTYTAEVLGGLGIHNVEVVGCPSFFLNPSATLGRELEKKLSAPSRSVAFCQGEFHNDQRAVERKVFDWASKRGAPYVCQAPEKVISLARGRLDELSDADIDAIRSYLSPDLSPEEFLQVAQASFKTFFDIDAWLAHLKQFDLSVGARLHGNILAVQAGTPGIIIPHDSRTNELARTGRLPVLSTEQFLECADVEEVKRRAGFDGLEFDTTRHELASKLARILRDSGLEIGAELSGLAAAGPVAASPSIDSEVTSRQRVETVSAETNQSIKAIDFAPSYIHPLHVRAKGIWPQYGQLQTRLRGRVYYSDILQPTDQWTTWKGEPTHTVPLDQQKPENYHDTHNHYQLILSEVLNFIPGANAIPIWGDGAAIAQGSGAWGAFFSARSSYYDPTTMRGSFVPEGFKAVPRDEFDCQLTGLEVDVLNGGKPGVYPNKAKHGISIVGFGNPNSHALSVICENFDCAPELRKGQFEAGIYFQNSIHPEYGRLIVSDFDKSHIGLDFRRTLFKWGAVQIKSAGPGTGIVFDEGKGGEIYTGSRWVGQDTLRWQTIRMAEEGLRIVTPDGKREVLAVDAYGGLYLSGDIYLNGRKFQASSEASPGGLLRQIATVLLQRVLKWLERPVAG
ncbi:polysaccharide pyruvyl transferase family protein [Microvirga sp. 2MCAF38]|uniref:polysaccharide pyruvyl transferase family protein n=1 Tax=Microvirga sp. 2MCAF38 TaxID=3232989 RepID=UPI003F9A2CA4